MAAAAALGAGAAGATVTAPAKKHPPKKHEVEKTHPAKGKAVALKPPFLDCKTLMPVARLRALTGIPLTSVGVQKVTIRGRSVWSSTCHYRDAKDPGPMSAAISFAIGSPSEGRPGKSSFEYLVDAWSKDAAKAAATPQCQPGYAPPAGVAAPDPDACRLLRPFGVHSAEFAGYVIVLEDGYQLTAQIGGDSTPAQVRAMAGAVLAKIP
ncbi:MAG TPA: hypothetical protein VFJ77_11840 [Gaiellaceae bacterium]|nr:hypothetical protein [Gaiellaceae bacterium]